MVALDGLGGACDGNESCGFRCGGDSFVVDPIVGRGEGAAVVNFDKLRQSV